MNDYSFKAICSYLREHDPKLVSTIDDLLGPALAITAAGAAVSGLFPPGVLLQLLSPKSTLVAGANKLLKHVTGKKYGNSVDRINRMSMAHSLLTYAAFFDSVAESTAKIVKSLALKRSDKAAFIPSDAKVAGGAISTSEPEPRAHKTTDLLETEISLPHPADDNEAVEKKLLALYGQMARSYGHYVHLTQEWARLEQKEQDRIDVALKDPPALAVSHYRAQYLRLSGEFPEFLRWTTWHKDGWVQNTLKDVNKQLKAHVEQTARAESRIDIGFHELRQTILEAPSRATDAKYDRIIAELARRYASSIERPVVESSSSYEAQLSFPRRSEAFVPQGFKVLRASGKERLEDETTWNDVPSRDDLGTFIVSYLTSPHSHHYPLLVLGDPGSGKSLLTHMLAARFISAEWMPIRLELRSLESDNIVSQIEEQVANETNGQKVSWPELTHHLSTTPPLIILDGYDELLQTTGKVYSDYLYNVRQFQDVELTTGRPPVRVIVTSRITLIDKTRIPAGTTVLRLEPFDVRRQQTWIEVWNKTNRQYFLDRAPNTKPFSIPDNAQIADLAQQPLLLLMLAIYDSDNNALSKKQDLDRVLLYDDLLRRFIMRELEKDAQFRKLAGEAQEERISDEMGRLGVAALSMYNRRSLYIRPDELDLDLKLFASAGSRPNEERSLRKSELLLGSFFFVHESRSKSKPSSEPHGASSSFQFLHNTFGEFLTAHFLVEQLHRLLAQLAAMESTPALASELTRKLSGPAGLGSEWLSCLIYTALFTRPVVLEMVREWLVHRVSGENSGISVDELCRLLDKLVSSELHRVLDRPHTVLVPTEQMGSCSALPVLGHAAVYAVNLVLLRAMAPDGCFEIDERRYSTHEDGTRPWERLVHLWRAWFSIDALSGLAAVVSATRTGTTVRLSARKPFMTNSPADRLDLIRDVSRVLCDATTATLADVARWDRVEPKELRAMADAAATSGIDLEAEITLHDLRRNLQLIDIPSVAGLWERAIDSIRKLSSERPMVASELALCALKLARRRGESAIVYEISNLLTRWACTCADDQIHYPLSVINGLDVGDIDPIFLDEVISTLGRRDVVSVYIRNAALVVAISSQLPARRSSGLLFEKLAQSPADWPRPDESEVEATIAFSLGVISHVLRDHRRTWRDEVRSRVWLEYLTPATVFAGSPLQLLAALEMLPLAAPRKTAHSWLRALVDKAPNSPLTKGLYGAHIIAAMAGAAIELDHEYKGALAHEVMKLDPRALALGIDWLHRVTSDFGARLRPLGLRHEYVEKLCRIAEVAPKKDAAKKWLTFLVDEVVLPEFGSVQGIPRTLLLTLLRVGTSLGGDPLLALQTSAARRNLYAERDELDKLIKDFEGS